MIYLMFVLFQLISICNCASKSNYKKYDFNGTSNIMSKIIFQNWGTNGAHKPIECGAKCSATQDCNIFAIQKTGFKTCLLGSLTNKKAPLSHMQLLQDPQPIFINQGAYKSFVYFCWKHF